MENPFIITGYIKPEYFCDREKEAERIINKVTGGENMVVMAARRVGKSKLIDFCMDSSAIKDHFICISIDILRTSSIHEFAFELGKAVFDLMDESNGTRNLLFLAGPVLDILRKGLTLVIDELDTSLHTLLLRELVRLFHRPEVNTGGAQLIFTTHDTSLLDAPDLFRRDQVWFVEKDRDQATALVGLSEFSPRKNEALERGYLLGRYGGVPFLDESLGLEH